VALFRFLVDRTAPKLPKIGLLLAALYVVWPLDLIPDAIPVIGWLDDVGIVAASLAWLAREVARHDARRRVLAAGPGGGA
jgi:uncharacterized membrane protein YkvA (DUF1232 family)